MPVTYQNVDGTLKEMRRIYQNIGGTVKKISEGYQNVDGVNKLVFKDINTVEDIIDAGGNVRFTLSVSITTDYRADVDNVTQLLVARNNITLFGTATLSVTSGSSNGGTIITPQSNLGLESMTATQYTTKTSTSTPSWSLNAGENIEHMQLTLTGYKGYGSLEVIFNSYTIN